MSPRLDLSDLLKRSEDALWDACVEGDDIGGRAAAAVTRDLGLFDRWRARHEYYMRPVADSVGRFGQPARLRALGVRLIERCAPIEFMRAQQVTGVRRDAIVMDLQQSPNPVRALLDSHSEYLLSLSSIVCVDHLLVDVADSLGPRLLARYRELYLECYALSGKPPFAALQSLGPCDVPEPLWRKTRRLKTILETPPDLVTGSLET